MKTQCQQCWAASQGWGSRVQPTGTDPDSKSQKHLSGPPGTTITQNCFLKEGGRDLQARNQAVEGREGTHS